MPWYSKTNGFNPRVKSWSKTDYVTLPLTAWTAHCHCLNVGRKWWDPEKVSSFTMVYFARLSDQWTERYCVTPCNLNHDVWHHTVGIVFCFKLFKDDIKSDLEKKKGFWNQNAHSVSGNNLQGLNIAQYAPPCCHDMSKVAILLHYLDLVYNIPSNV